MHVERKYRPDIDGLRAIAVLLVVLNHLQFRHFDGGYVGVDVFFVISGYLIGSSLIEDFRGGSFSLAAFYERRIRRIFPALLGMLLVVSVLAYHYLMPDDLVDYARSLLAALLSFSNFLFWRQSGYFDDSSTSKPLLHTWSLGVEEQFYVLFPLVLYMLFRWKPQRLRPVLWTLAALSFAATLWTMRTDASAAFFWSPLRAWELLAGVLISEHAFAAFRRRWLRETAALAGFLLILVAGITYTSLTPFPGWAALLPCLGAVLLIATGQVGTTLAGRLLSTRPFTFIGLISYSLYLWHWPFTVFQVSHLMLLNRPYYERSPKLLLLGLSLAVATLSWWLIETPFRKGRFKPKRARLLLINGVAAGLLACAALGAVLHQGMRSRFPDDVLRVASFGRYDTSTAWRTGTCFILPVDTFSAYQPATCLSPDPGRKVYLLYGDSLGAALYPGLVKIFPEIHFQQATVAACPPYLNATASSVQYVANCVAMQEYIHTTYLATQHPDAVILAGGWNGLDLPKLESEIQLFKQKNIPVVLMGPTLRFDLPLPLLLSSMMLRHETGPARIQNLSQHVLAAQEQLDKTMGRMAAQQHVRYISYFEDLCGQQVELAAKAQWETSNGCPVFTDKGDPLTFDWHHLTESGAEQFLSTARRLGQLP